MDRKERALASHESANPRDLIDARCDWHLSNWSEWFQNYQHGLGFKHRSGVLCGYGSMSVDDMYSEMDRGHARVIDAIIDGLTPLQQCAIHNVYIADVWKSGRGLSMTDVFVEAASEVWRLAVKRGVS